MSKSKTKNADNRVSIRIRGEAKAKAALLLAAANKKKFGKKIKFDDLVEIALGLVTDEHLKMLQKRSMTFEDQKELLRQKYIETRGLITRDEFLGFMMEPGFGDFLKEYELELKAA